MGDRNDEAKKREGRGGGSDQTSKTRGRERRTEEEAQRKWRSGQFRGRIIALLLSQRGARAERKRAGRETHHSHLLCVTYLPGRISYEPFKMEFTYSIADRNCVNTSLSLSLS